MPIIAAVGDLFKALADPTRRAILDELQQRDGQTLFELCVRLITKHGLGSTRQAISQHLDVLEDAGLVQTRREGRYKFHDLDTAPLREIAERWPIRPTERRAPMRRSSSPASWSTTRTKALRFYTDVLGFVTKHDIPLGRGPLADRRLARGPGRHRAAARAGRHPAAKPFKAALVEDGIPCTSFGVDDVQAEYERLRGLGVRFTQEPTADGTGDDRRLRRHLRQPDPDRAEGLKTGPRDLSYTASARASVNWLLYSSA